MKEKLSVIIEEMIRPYHDGETDMIKLLTGIACYAWNSTIVPSKEYRIISKSIMEIFNNDKEINELVESLKIYKKLNYPNDDRVIVKYENYFVKNELRLRVEYISWNNHETNKEK